MIHYENMGKFFTGLFVIAVLSIISGFTLFILWGWFLIPIGAPQISVVIAMGIMLIIRTSKGVPKPDKDAKLKWGKSLLLTLVWNGFSLLFGWIYTLFM